MGVDIGGRHTVAGVFIIPILRRTVELTGATVIILMRRLTMITTQELTAGMGVPMGRTGSTPYGSRSAAQAYNPYTGTYAQTRQGSSPNAQWGSSYVSRGNQSATTGHYSTANGTVAGVSTSQGGKAAGANTAWGNSAAGKTANGNMYAEHDGNVYKSTGNGWEKYDNGNWNSV